MTKRKSEVFDHIRFSTLLREQSIDNLLKTSLKLGKILQIRTPSTKSFPQFQHFQMWKITLKQIFRFEKNRKIRAFLPEIIPFFEDDFK